MAYKFIDEITAIVEGLDIAAEAAKEKLQAISSRQMELKSELAALESRHLRAEDLKSRADLICPECFIIHGNEFSLTSISSPDRSDHYRCRECDSEYAFEP